MTAFHEYLRARLETGGFSTEDTLTSFLPLVREVVDAHAAGLVAPLEGLDALRVEDPRIWFEEARRVKPRNSTLGVRQIEAAARAAVEVVSEQRRVTDIADGFDEVVDLAIADRDSTITRPVYLPGYVTWEHQIGHHDPLTDIFSLGMILASLACGMDFMEPDQLKAFVAGRRNLFGLNPDLHPVLARAIFRTTELDRHRRVQDLRALLHHLENYRDQDVDFEFDLARISGFVQKDNRSKQHVVLSKLKERLFELSRRNRLLHFRPTMQTLNLTHASIPLSFDIKNIRPDQVLVWNDSLHAAVCGGKPISLNKYLNFAEALYVPGVLDRVIADARRDRAEFGFAQLRLVICFLHWANLKEKPIEQFESPLVLLPVELKKKKGIRDTYTLVAPSPEAEINPVIRHQFKQLYDIDLPEQIDLSSSNLDRFYEYLQSRIEASEAAVTLDKIDRPRIALVYDKARRKLDQYRRRARIAGRGVRSFMDLDYSYDPATYHPLGIKLFSAKIRPPRTHLREIIEEKPRPRTFAAPPPEPPVAEKERSFYSLQEGGEANPYVWGFDLCSVTLGNFKYRKMSLVRDYEALLDQQPPNPAFEATFSLVPRPVDGELPTTPTLEERYDVVPCDPTQATAIEEARAEKSYIIQGPPGTGKSQTITNLIADYVARGKRVLFVCEKRAAIDVVYARLRQCGLADLCCLIHDSQTDKKEFVMDLKQTYEGILADGDGKAKGRKRRRTLLKRLADEISPLEGFDSAMQETPEDVGIPIRQLLSRCVELRHLLPDLSPLERERLPDYVTWWRNRERIDAFDICVRDIRRDGILSNHALRLLSPRLVHVERPLELITNAVQAAGNSLDRIEQTLGQSGIPRDQWLSAAQVRSLVDYAKRVLPIARGGHLALLDSDNARASDFSRALRQLRQAHEAVAETRSATKAWREKLSADEVSIALEQARSFEGSLLAWLKPAWWRLRAILKRCYDFRSHVVRPSWTHVLKALEREYALQEELNGHRKEIAATYEIEDDVDELANRIAELQASLAELPDWIVRIHAALVRSDEAARTVANVTEADDAIRLLTAEMDKIADDYEDAPLDQLRANLQDAIGALDDLPAFLQCLTEVAALPDALGTALRTSPFELVCVEAATADRALEESLRAKRDVGRFSGVTRQRHVNRLERLYRDWLASNATDIRRTVQQRFLENVHVASLPASQLDAEQKEFKRRYNQGRRELEHEFGKSMRYKSIRDLVSGESGDVVKDLKPVWLMSPLSVSDTLPLDTEHFDVVIFDEASQITLEEAIPSIFRACQAIVVGDEMQLPPTDFFSAKRDGDEQDELLVEEDGELVQYDLESNSFLNHAAKNLASTMLGWHYRSRSESLISYSNWTFYDGRLLTVPEEGLPVGHRALPEATEPTDAKVGAAGLLERSISFHFMEHGVYEKRRNRAEADYIAHLVHELLRGESGRTIGIVAFSEAQQDEIEGALQRLAQTDAKFRDRLEAEQEREVDGQFVGLLVKNLENIQGDERDVIILSVCYGYGPNGKMLMNFGPINKSGGEKRLNVAFSRAKHHMALVSSIRHSDITNEYNDGANCLKNYLRYAEAVSNGNTETARRVLRGMSRWHDTQDEEEYETNNPVAGQLAEALTDRGYVVDFAVGQSQFRCDLAVRQDGDTTYRLGILLDNRAYYEQSDLLERDMMRPKLLRDFGWKMAFVLAKDWYEDREAVMDRLLRLLEGHDEDIEEDEEEEDLVEDEDEKDEPEAEESETDVTADAASSDILAPPQSRPLDTAPDVAQTSTATQDPELADGGDDSAATIATVASSDENRARRFEFTSDKSNKFWEITLSGSTHTVRFGRIGTNGQTKTKQFDDATKAKRDYERLIRSKLSKGYREQ